MILSLIILVIKGLKINHFNHIFTDFNSTLQLQHLLNRYESVEVFDDHLKLKKSYFFDDDCELVFKNNKLFLQPGVNILFSDIKNVKFNLESGGKLEMTLVRKEQKKRFKYEI